MPSSNYADPPGPTTATASRPDLAAVTGALDARARRCHAGKPVRPGRPRRFESVRAEPKPHYGAALVGAAKGERADAALAAVVADPQNPAIARDGARPAARLSPATRPSVWPRRAMSIAEVAAAAADAVEGWPPAQRTQASRRCCGDPVRGVRHERHCACSSASTWRQMDDAVDAPDLRRGAAEYIAAQELALDMPGAAEPSSLSFYQQTGKPDAAEARTSRR